MKPNSLFLGFATGAAFASIAVLLSAPQAGSQTRAAAKHSLKNGLEQAQLIKQTSKQIADQAKTTFELSKTVGKQTGIELKRSIDTWKKEIEPSKNALTSHLVETQNELMRFKKELQKE